ncbi:MAG: 3-dehydroquinate synthase [Actinobacteria bacterium HGW-Actinobacteria-7]|nr:MAG: 3-dehydroquinate synthase [Actinobacteria bacterium HGW-Actinobacteria-7]
MTKKLRVNVPGAAYDVIVGAGVMGDCGRLLSGLTDARTVALVSDETVAKQYSTQADIAFAQAGFRVMSLTVPAGETSKNWALAGDLLEEFARLGLGRTDVVVALGGGVIGDLAGFAAAVYLRGVSFMQMPTTLLAMVDSSVGGKTGVDLSAGKNLAGAFKQPLLVLADTQALASLPDEQWRSGIAEVVKSAVLDGEAFLSWVEEQTEALNARDGEVVEEVVARSMAFKSGIVARDEREEGPRECLNYGHTLGHALEKVLGYGTITHGEAVAEGMRFAARVAVDVGQADATFVKRQDHLLDALGLRPLRALAEPSALIAAMRSDKKARGGSVRMVLADGPGLWRCVAVDDGVLDAHLEAWAETKREG